MSARRPLGRFAVLPIAALILNASVAFAAGPRVVNDQCNALLVPPSQQASGVRTQAGGSVCVRVTPDDSAITRAANTNGFSEAFWVINDSPSADSYDLSCFTSPSLTCTGLSQTTLSLNPGDSAEITAFYNTGSAGSVTLDLSVVGTVSGSDVGSYAISVVAPPTYTVSVTPDGGSQATLSPSTGNVATFTVQNNGNQGTVTYTMSVQGCTSPLTTCTPDSATVTVGQGASTPVAVHFNVQNALGTGTITLRATHTPSGTVDNGSINVSTSAVAFALDVTQNFKDRLDKTGCVTGNAGPGAAFYCGELLVMQPMVGYRSMSRGRAPTLVYSSRAATGTAEALMDVTLPGVTTVPDKVVATLWMDGLTRDSVFFNTTGWAAGSSRRLVIPVSPGLASGVHDGKVALRRVTGGSSVTDTAALSLVVVRRDSSPFGAGWWIGGVDRAYTNPGATAVAFVDPEGSAVVFRKVGANWVAPAGETSSLVVEGATYKRTLKNQIVLRYDLGNGRLFSATDPVGNVATYTWVANAIDGLRLDHITDEVSMQVGFGYDANGRLATVTVPGVLATKVYANATTWNVDSIVDPDTVKTSFGYAASTHAMTTRHGRHLGESSTYTYVTTSTTTGLLASITAPDGTLNHRAYQVEGLPASGTGTDANKASPGLTANAVVTLKDYRAVATQINVDRLGRPTRIAAQDSGIVTIARDAATSLPTAMQWSPLGRTINLFWNFSTSDLDSTIEASNSNAKSQFTYQPTFHGVTRAITPTGDTTFYNYDGTTGLLQRAIAPGRDTTTFTYNSRGLASTITEPGHAYATQYQYDSVSGSWNVVSITSPGGRITRYVYDANRTDVDTLIQPDLVSQIYVYDALKRVRQLETYPHSGTLARRIKTDYLRTVQNGGGEHIVRHTVPSATAFEGYYITDSTDAMGRVMKSCVPAMGGNCQTYGYVNGLLSTMNVATDGSSSLNTRGWAYDSLGRVIAFQYSAPSGQSAFTAHAVFSDTDTLWYNQIGEVTRAANSRSLVERAYDPSGRLACEHQTSKRWDNLSYTSATTMGIKYYYDLSGRLLKRVFGRATFQAPPAGQPQNACVFTAGTDTGWVRLHYDLHGRVDSIIGWNLKKDSTIVFRFQFDSASRRKLTSNNRNGWQESWTYDDDDFPATHTVQDTHGIANPPVAVQDQFLYRDGMGRVQTRYGVDGYFYYRYDALGQVDTAGSEPYYYDAYGAGQMNAGNFLNYTYDNTTSRLTNTLLVGVPRNKYEYYRYNRAGDRILDSLFWSSSDSVHFPRQTLTNYDGAGRTAEMKLVALNGDAPAGSNHWWTYWYDALGRRVLEADSTSTLGSGAEIQRFIYDGANVLLSGGNWWQFGTDTYPLQLHQQFTEAYLYDLGVDQPLYWAGTTSQITACQPSGEHFYESDEKGSIKQEAYDNGALCAGSGYAYEAYGKFTSGSTIGSSRPGYTGAAQDASGLIFLRNRYYDPNTRTFTQTDPIGLAGGVNMYGYAGNNPISQTDPFGLWISVPNETLRNAIRELMNSSPTFRQMFRTLYLAPAREVNIRMTACSESRCSDEAALGGGHTTIWRFGRQDVEVQDQGRSHDELLAIVSHELAHVAAFVPNSGVTCNTHEDPQDCANRYHQTIMDEYKASLEKKETKRR